MCFGCCKDLGDIYPVCPASARDCHEQLHHARNEIWIIPYKTWKMKVWKSPMILQLCYGISDNVLNWKYCMMAMYIFGLKPSFYLENVHILVILVIFWRIYRSIFCHLRIKKYRPVVIFFPHFLWTLRVVLNIILLCQSPMPWNGKGGQEKITQKISFSAYEVADGQQVLIKGQQLLTFLIIR